MLEIYHVNIYECHNIMYNKDINKYEENLHEIIKYGAMLVENDYKKLKEIMKEISMEEETKKGILDSMEEYSEDEEMAYYYDVEHDRMATYNGSISEAEEKGKEEIKRL